MVKAITPPSIVQYPRTKETQELIQFLTSPKSGFMYLRGRRRIGKSWILKQLRKARSNVFYFSGKDDSTNLSSMAEFGKEWDAFKKTRHLMDLKKSALSWGRIFQEITVSVQNEQRQTPLCLIFDEIQWLAKEKSGFCGSLKEAWLDWEQLGQVKVIICGSSNKFFQTKTGGEEQILRGIVTRAPLWIKPIPLKGIQKYFLPSWTREEVTFLYFITGGVPYYLQQIDEKLGFIHAINQAFFLQDSLFLNEVNEILRLDFNTAGLETVKTLLSAFTPTGSSLTEIEQATGIPHSTVASAFEKLQDYKLILETGSVHKKGIKKPEIRYRINDFYLNFYFQVLKPLSKVIERNKTRLLFSEFVLGSKSTYYVEGFTGTAFEHLVQTILEQAESLDLKLFEKLLLKDFNFEVFPFSDKTNQIDLVITHSSDRILRLLECKWGKEDPSWIAEVLKKNYPLKQNEQGTKILRVIVCGYPPSKAFQAHAKAAGIPLVVLKDLF